MQDFAITTGLFPLAALLMGALALLFLLIGRTSSWWRRRVPIALAATIALTAALTFFANSVWHPFADPLPPVVVLWIGLTLSGFSLAAVRKGPAWPRVGAVALAMLIGVCGVVQVNTSFGAYPTIRAAFNQALPNQVDLQKVLASSDPGAAAIGPAPAPTAPSVGQVTSAPIPGTTSGFSAGDALIYLPPAYFASPRPPLPVLILLAGQPGTPRNWFDGGTAAQTMDAYAKAHHGRAPVVVVPDWLGTTGNNPMCVNSSAGNDFSYLSVDVPNWIKSNLHIDTNPARWAVGGLSSGGTCALQLAVNAPLVYPTFMCFSGQEEPTLSNRSDTVAQLFNGNEKAFKAINPIDVLQARTFPHSAGLFIVGQQDHGYRPQNKTLYTVTKAAGADAQYLELPGGHDFPFWAAALAASTDWLGAHLGITG